VFSGDPKLGFLAHAHKFGDALAQNQVLAPAKSIIDMQRIVQNDYVDASLALFFVAVVVLTLLFGARAAWKAWRINRPTALETPYVAAPIR
jgi:hypothetical protein